MPANSQEKLTEQNYRWQKVWPLWPWMKVKVTGVKRWVPSNNSVKFEWNACKCLGENHRTKLQGQSYRRKMRLRKLHKHIYSSPLTWELITPRYRMPAMAASTMQDEMKVPYSSGTSTTAQKAQTSTTLMAQMLLALYETHSNLNFPHKVQNNCGILSFLPISVNSSVWIWSQLISILVHMILSY